MPKEFIWESCITIDHEENTLRLDTTVTSVATAARRAGMREITTDTSKPYRRFIAMADQVRFRRPKGQRRVTGAAAKKQAAKSTTTV
jgi:hypothetical protein